MRLERGPEPRHTTAEIARSTTSAELLGGILTIPTSRPRTESLPDNSPRGIRRPASADQRTGLLDRSSQILTKDEPFTKSDLFAFAENMEKAAGGIHLGKGETLIVVPDIIPKTGVEEIVIHKKVDATGASINVVTRGAGDKPDTRYVIGEDFSRGVNHSTRPSVKNSEVPYSKRTDVLGVSLDVETDGRRLMEDIYVAHLANAGRIAPEQASEVKEQLHEGTPVTELVAAK